MDIRRAIMSVLPELVELEDVDFSRYSSQYLPTVVSFAQTGKAGLREFEEFVLGRGVDKSIVGNFLVSLFQYLMILYRRYDDYSAVKPAIKVFLTLKGWLNENGFERQWDLLLHNFIGHLVGMGAEIAEREDCETANTYLTLIHRFAEESGEKFPESYFKDLAEKSREVLRNLREKCGFRSANNERNAC